MYTGIFPPLCSTIIFPYWKLFFQSRLNHMFIPNTWNIFHKSGYSWISHVETWRYPGLWIVYLLDIWMFHDFSGFCLDDFSICISGSHPCSPVDLQVLWVHSGWTMPPEICSDLDHFLRQLYTYIHWNVYIYTYCTKWYVCIYIYIWYMCQISVNMASSQYQVNCWQAILVSTLYQFQSWCFKSYYNIYIYVFSYTGCFSGGGSMDPPSIWLNSGALEVLGFPSEVSGPRRDFGPDLSQMEPRPKGRHRRISMAFRMFIVGYPLVNVYSLRTGTSPSLIGKSTNCLCAIFNSYVKLPEAILWYI